MYKAILIDDEPLASMIVKEFLEQYPEIEVIQVCQNGFEGLKAIQQLNPHLVFLDIQMPKINGFEMLELIDQPPSIIFTTAFDEYAIRAFEQNAVDYLLKPFTLERFKKAVDKFLQQQAKQTDEQEKKEALEHTQSLLETASISPQQIDRIVIRENNNIRIIPVEEIQYVEAADDYVRIVTQAGSWLKNRTMAAIEKQLPVDRFVRIHRSCIVNIREITRLHPHEKESWMAILRNGKQLPVSKTGYPKLKAQLGI
ncbi:LytR/AlgR family response regulator transcription factor [Flavihumibacter sp.]|uniref:LytR/AlgR family response regulator transcription factor n=1 Tax=Flavihumibacter sp. TaxID=1913981 RepID=UPI002FCB8F01|nr:LytTR family DNA-binding domain-containing protein [Flavihumibacter sediminis]